MAPWLQHHFNCTMTMTPQLLPCRYHPITLWVWHHDYYNTIHDYGNDYGSTIIALASWLWLHGCACCCMAIVMTQWIWQRWEVPLAHHPPGSFDVLLHPRSFFVWKNIDNTLFLHVHLMHKRTHVLNFGKMHLYMQNTMHQRLLWPKFLHRIYVGIVVYQRSDLLRENRIFMVMCSYQPLSSILMQILFRALKGD